MLTHWQQKGDEIFLEPVHFLRWTVFVTIPQGIYIRPRQMGMMLDDRIGHIVAPGLGLGHDWHPGFVVGNACDATAGALGQWALSALSFSSLFLSLCRYGLRCYPFAELAEIELDT